SFETRAKFGNFLSSYHGGADGKLKYSDVLRKGPTSIRELTSQNVSRLWVIPGIVTAASKPKTLKLQERPEDIPTGELPRTILMAVDRNLSHYAPTFTSEEEAKFREFAANPNIYQELYARRIAPQIHGHENIKKAIACLLFGGARKRMPDGTNRRGDVNVLLIGDPSTAKSQFLKFASKIAPIAVYTSGKGSSAAGLTATVIRDNHGEFYLEGGAMVLADGGVVCIDEFDKMRAEDRVAIHEAMEQQTISVAKAGITTMLKSRTSVLAAANPPSGRYDDLKSAQENIDLQTTLLSRFDLIFIVKDERNPDKDMMIARHVLATHGNAGREQQADEKAKQEERELKRYIEYCRARCSPRLSPHAANRLVDEYVKIREDARQVSEDESAGGAAVPITVRQLEAIIRIAESLARMQLKPVAGPEHVDEAIYLFNQATVDALKSGIHEGQLAGGDSEEILRVQEQIKSRVAIGSYVSEQRITQEMLRLGLSEFTVQKAIHFLVAQKEFEYRRERRLLYRAMGSQH
ncbi:hypothetical protein WJX84_000936, partial [Apatococcus fuscideae]